MRIAYKLSTLFDFKKILIEICRSIAEIIFLTLLSDDALLLSITSKLSYVLGFSVGN